MGRKKAYAVVAVCMAVCALFMYFFPFVSLPNYKVTGVELLMNAFDRLAGEGTASPFPAFLLLFFGFFCALLATVRQAFPAGAAVAFVFGAALQISGLGGLSSYLGAGFFLQLFFLAAGVVFSIAALAAKDASAADDEEDEPQQFCWICHKCDTLNRGLYCTDCGASAFSGEILKCRRCGWEPEGDADVPRFCPKCGSRFDGTGGRDA